MTDIVVPPLFRAALEVTLENAGVEKPRVSKSGEITEWDVSALPEEKRMTTDDPLLVCQSIFLAAHLVQILSGERPRVAQELLKLVSGEGAEVLEKEFRDVFAGHEFTPADLRDCLSRCATMISGAKNPINPNSRTTSRR